jgi:hypothetical protein
MADAVRSYRTRRWSRLLVVSCLLTILLLPVLIGVWSVRPVVISFPNRTYVLGAAIHASHRPRGRVFFVDRVAGSLYGVQFGTWHFEIGYLEEPIL